MKAGPKPEKGKKDRSKTLLYEPKLIWDSINSGEKKKVLSFAEGYKNFLNRSKTEREAVSYIRNLAGDRGFTDRTAQDAASPFFCVFHEKAIALIRPGKMPLEKGIRLIVSHIDAPRLDLKQRPLYEDTDLAFLKTHYYGGIRKYQWLARPLAIHGRIVKIDGSTLDITVGESESDPVFTIMDLLPHLSGKLQNDKKISEVFQGEKLNIVAGGLPADDKEVQNRFKLSVLDCLSEAYGLVEEDFISAELEIVPAGTARDVGWDRSLIGAYGQDDRSSAYAGLMALLDADSPEKTGIALFVDKEEIGSDGATSAKSKFFESVIFSLMEKMNKIPSSVNAGRILAASQALSADTNAALDPDYQEVHEKRNAARLGYGVCITKFTGQRGKYGANDANAEYLGWLRKIFNKGKVNWQTGELGRVDEGGGGTVAKFLAVYGMEIVDCGAPLLSMHSPFEISHKGDIFMTYKAFKTFFEAPS